MNLKPSKRARERILVYGPAGTSKSYSLLTIAKMCDKAQFYVVDNDRAYERLLEDEAFEGLHVEEGGNVHLYEVHDWEGTQEALAKIEGLQTREDWLVIDSLTPTWQYVQDYFTEQVFDQGLDEYFLQTRIAKKKLKEGDGKDGGDGMFEGWKDWPVINSIYAKGIHDPILNCTGHVYCTAEYDSISRDEKDKAIKTMYGALGSKPKGQKRNPHIFQTVLLMRKERTGGWKMSTAKDRSRVELEDVEVGERFGKSYLWEVAGWRPKAG